MADETDSRATDALKALGGAGPQYRRIWPALLCALTAFSGLLYGSSAEARVNVASDLHQEYDTCIAKFTAAGLRDLVDALDRSDNVFTIERWNRSSTETTPDSRADSRSGPPGTGGKTRWNPDATPPLPGEGFNQDPCATLYHEMSHLVDYDQGRNDDRLCAPYGISRKEVAATRAENRYRRSQPDLRDKLRQYYDGNAMPPDEYRCAPQPTRERERRGCGAGCAVSNGDVHLTTYDGRNYDLQSIGEFVLSRSRDSTGFEVQARQAALSGAPDISINSAVALDVAGDRIAFYMTSEGGRLRVDGGPPVPTDTVAMSLPRGGDIVAFDDGEISVLWPDGSEALLYAIGRYGYRIGIRPADRHRGRLEGLLGDFDGDPHNDLVVRGGPPLRDDGFETVHDRYDDSWRIAQSNSLFDYEGARTTEHHTDRRAPRKAIALDTHPGRARAERLCRDLGVRDPARFRDCVFDVAVTGAVEFAHSAARTERLSTAGRGGATALTLSGALSGTLDQAAVDCTHLTAARQFGATIEGRHRGQPLSLTFTIVSAFGGPGVYGVASLTSAEAVASASHGGDAYASTADDIGKLVVDDDGRSGSINARLGALRVTGRWICDGLTSL